MLFQTLLPLKCFKEKSFFNKLLNGIRYVCLFYRDIFPVGWNIANGASDSYAELYFPDRIIKREFGEEFVVADHDNGILKFYEPGPENISPGYQKAIVVGLDNEFKAFGFAKYKCQKLVTELLDGPDRVSVSADGDSQDSEGVFLNITPSDNAIEVDRIAYVVLDGNYSFIDGEIVNGLPLGRMVGLFRLDNIGSLLEKKEFIPDLYFAEGQEGKEVDFKVSLQNCIRKIQRHRRRNQRENYQACEHKWDLCPITRSLLGRLLKSLDAGTVKFPDEP